MTGQLVVVCARIEECGACQMDNACVKGGLEECVEFGKGNVEEELRGWSFPISCWLNLEKL
jgi:positive regulator of sigma E activity